MIVVVGATGNVGGPLVGALAAAGARVTAVSRGTPEVPVPDGVQHLRADLVEPASLRPVLDGADAMYLIVSGAGAHLSPPDIMAVARDAGVGRIVLQSSQAAGTRPDSPSHAPLRTLEDAVRQSGLRWTILRPGGFHSNAYAWVESIRTSRTAAAPFGDVGLPMIDPVDIAEVAAAVLTTDGHAGQVYELTGPALVSPRQRAAAIGDALGEPVRFVEQTRNEARADLLRFMPEPVADGTLAILGMPSEAERRVSPDVEKVLGRPPHAFADWAVRNVAAFR
ncbi:NAD(P)H-binding protein [Plantactinospora sp. GCM10030261]|uniref:NAD(P)H-binding protein n=1 Tax=Plantactinospora sp. GCM10030261 TaxID=3273420 RepID=UPI0036154A77